MDLTKKMGPLPVWAWGLILGIGGYIVYSRSRSSTGTGATPTDSVLDPNAIDPNTGLTYGQEEDAALNANAGLGGGSALSGGGGTSNSGAQGTVDPTGTGAPDIFTTTDPGIIAAINAALFPPTASPSTTTAAGSAPVSNAHPPTVTATTHTSPVQVADHNQSTAVLGQVNSLLSQGFKKVSGTTQAGGLAQTGTYTYTPPKGASLKTGPTKYFVWGTQATGLHIRAA